MRCGPIGALHKPVREHPNAPRNTRGTCTFSCLCGVPTLFQFGPVMCKAGAHNVAGCDSLQHARASRASHLHADMGVCVRVRGLPNVAPSPVILPSCRFPRRWPRWVCAPAGVGCRLRRGIQCGTVIASWHAPCELRCPVCVCGCVCVCNVGYRSCCEKSSSKLSSSQLSSHCAASSLSSSTESHSVIGVAVR